MLGSRHNDTVSQLQPTMLTCDPLIGSQQLSTMFLMPLNESLMRRSGCQLSSHPPFPSPSQVFNNLIELVTSCGNYSQYRKRFSECSGFRFPILGVHLKDLIAVHVALTDWADKEKTRVNLAKAQQLYAILQELALIQITPPHVDANTDLLNLLTVSGRNGPPPPPPPDGSEVGGTTLRRTDTLCVQPASRAVCLVI